MSSFDCHRIKGQPKYQQRFQEDDIAGVLYALQSYFLIVISLIVVMRHNRKGSFSKTSNGLKGIILM